MTIHDFSFGARAENFETHISSSIPGYDQLIGKCVELSRRFVQSGTTVLDVGCSTGKLLNSVRKHNVRSRRGVAYRGIDIEPQFTSHWRKIRAKNIRFQICDARSYQGFDNVSLACSLFTLQFIPPPDKVPLLQRIHSGLTTGGSIIIAEKILASTSRLQDALTFPYYDFKLRKGFTADEILDKERSLRGQMTLWTDDELRRVLRQVGFRELEPVWANFPFVALLALK